MPVILQQLELGKEVPHHPAYLSLKQKRFKWELSTDGDCDDYKDNFFLEHEHETEKSQERRKTLTPVLNYCEPVIRTYNAMIFTSGIKRDIPDPFKDDVDLNGTAASDFFRKVGRRAQMLGEDFVLVDSNIPMQLTVAQARSLGGRLFLSRVHPNRVVNWLDDDDGNLLEVLVKVSDSHYFLLDDLFRVDIFVGDEGRVSFVSDPIVHEFSGLPVVRFRWDDEARKSHVSSISEMQATFFNIHSILLEELSKQTFSSFIITGANVSQLDSSNNPPSSIDPNPSAGIRFKHTDIGSRKFTLVDSEDAQIHPLSGNTSNSDALRKYLEDLRVNIRRQAGLLSNTETGNVESAKALRIKHEDVAVIASNMSLNFQKGENAVWDLVSMNSNVDIDEVVYESDFSREDAEARMKLALDAADRNIPPSVKSMLTHSAAGSVLDLSPDERVALKEEIEDFYGSEPE